jgi:hypothetical protein
MTLLCTETLLDTATNDPELSQYQRQYFACKADTNKELSNQIQFMSAYAIN